MSKHTLRDRVGRNIGERRTGERRVEAVADVDFDRRAGRLPAARFSSASRLRASSTNSAKVA
jgi:hypothetical protein